MENRILNLKQAGLNSEEISKELLIDKIVVDKILIKEFYKGPKENLNKLYSIIECRHSNIPISKACKEYGFSNSFVSRLFKRAGIYFWKINYFDYNFWTKENIEKLIKDFNSGIPIYKLVKKYGFHKNALAKIINENGGNTTPSTFNEFYFDKIDTEEKAYWLGFLYADGSVSLSDNGVELSLKILDAKHLFKFKQSLESKSTVRLDFKIGRCRINVCNKHFKNSLIKNGCTPQKSLTLKYNCSDIVDDKKLKVAFIRGYFDGDGSLSHTYSDAKKKRFTVSCKIIGTLEFLQWIENELLSYDIHVTWFKNKRFLNNTIEISFNKTNSVKFLNLIYTNANIYLDRKYKKYLFYSKHENFAVYVSDYVDYNRAISVEAKQWINDYFNIDFDSMHANTEIIKKSNDFLIS